MRDLARLCAILVPEESIRAELVRVAGAAGLEGVHEDADADTLCDGADGEAPLRLAVIDLSDRLHETLGLVSRLRQGRPDCVIFALDRADTECSAADALAAGADDVLRMPFRPAEFEARLHRILGPGAAPETIVEAEPETGTGGPAADSTELEALTAQLDLTPVESRILAVLLARKQQIVTRNELSQALHGRDWSYGDRRFDVHVTRIRRKLRQVPGSRYAVRTIRSVGYMLALAEDA